MGLSFSPSTSFYNWSPQSCFILSCIIRLLQKRLKKPWPPIDLGGRHLPPHRISSLEIPFHLTHKRPDILVGSPFPYGVNNSDVPLVVSYPDMPMFHR